MSRAQGKVIETVRLPVASAELDATVRFDWRRRQADPDPFLAVADFGTLTTAQWVAFKHEAVRRARQERNRALRAFGIAAMERIGLLRRAVGAWIGRHWRAYPMARRHLRVAPRVVAFNDLSHGGQEFRPAVDQYRSGTVR